ncbi:MAG: UDP-3-O-acyl-N-acetylglucosamine deacetylase [Acetobacteraceae bacterium]|nr:UDP-3-O-acyl-N-acetylglucosamine deacetylase [Acetobacteraceae bacterium]
MMPKETMPERVSSLWTQRTLKFRIPCVGTGLHTGRRVNLTLLPAPADHGIVFRRTDLGRDIPASYNQVVDTKLCTVVGEGSARVSTIEHLMAALAGAGIDNVLIEVDGPEVPIMDGSAAPFSFLLECAGTTTLDTPRKTIEILRPVRVTDGHAFAELRPFDNTTSQAARPAVPTLELEVSIDFADAAIGRQSRSLRLTPENFRDAVAPARTFGLLRELDHLRALGLAKGGSLDNAIIVDGDKILNPGGLRMKDEFVAHKLLDAVGDLALAGAALHGRFIAHRPGHGLTNKLLRALFANQASWADITPEHLAAVAA